MVKANRWVGSSCPLPLEWPLVEELSKFFAVRMWICHKADFKEPYDGIVHCVMSALGFAAVENVMYFMEGRIGLGILRAIT